MNPPVFFVGAPRSGTTILFDVFASHPQVAWLSNYATGAPRVPALNGVRRAAKRRPFRWVADAWPVRADGIGRLGIRPSEAYPFWNTHADPEFARSCLLDRSPSPDTVARTRAAVAAVVRWQGRPTFAAKITGPGRVGFLNAVFPDARFVHVVRDGRAVVRSLLEVAFWREGGGYERPWWSGWPAHLQASIDAAVGEPAGLAAAQWAALLELTRRELDEHATGRWLEVRYEAFTADPHATMREVQRFLDAPDAPEVHRFVDERVRVDDRNGKFRSGLSDGQRAAVDRAAGAMLAACGYSR